VRQFFEKDMQALPQDSSNATFFRNNREIHRRIFWNIHSSQEIYDLIRTGQGFCFFRNRKVVFLSAYMSESNRNLTNNVRVESGTIVDVGKDSISIKTIHGCINVKELQEGGKRFSFLEWARKKNLYIGEKFE
jgi:methionyl-tRNA formyltransferase